jgi:two-component system, OmpR family, sensor histidine kinase VanS
MNAFFIEKIYSRKKSETLKETYALMQTACMNRVLYKKSFIPEFDRMCVTGNLTIVVMSPNGSVVMSSAADNTSINLVHQFMDSVFNNISDDQRIIYESNSSYTLEKQEDSNLQQDFIVLWGNLPDGNTVVIRSALESIVESAQISNQFMLGAGGFAIVISILLTTFLTRKITKPITELSNLSLKMKNLDFDARFKPRKRSNEIDILGSNLNDMSENLKNSIADLKKANIELQHDIETRDKSDSMRKDFLSNVSHELKTPIALIQGYAEGLIDGVAENPEDMKYYLDVIVDESKKMNHLVQQLLSLNQLEFGYSDFELERFDIVPAISALIHNSAILLDRENISVIFDESQKVYVWGDEFFTEEIINNYLSNAIHYAKGDKKIVITLEKNDNKEVVFKVFNTGDKIPEESLEHLFEKFYKVDKARSREYGGSGIGLSVVKALADLSHKKCGVENEDNGVMFYFTFDEA